MYCPTGFLSQHGLVKMVTSSWYRRSILYIQAPEPLDVHPNRSIKEDGTRLSYLSPSSPRTLPKVPGTSQFEFGPVLPSSPQLEVLYEDPKEDVVSILSEVSKSISGIYFFIVSEHFQKILSLSYTLFVQAFNCEINNTLLRHIKRKS